MSKQLSFDDFVSRINKADKILLKTLRQKLMIIGLKAERQAKINATKFPRVRTGRLRSSIAYLVDSKGGNMRVLLRAGGDTRGAPVLYAKYVEFGTKFMRPRLFMGRAIRTAQKGMRKELKGLLKVALQAE